MRATLVLAVLLAAPVAPAALSAQEPAAADTAAVRLAAPEKGVPGGIVQPGMGDAQVRAAWGEPIAVRQMGEHTYMFFDNGCPASRCGMNDLVILQGGQVVDAVVRSPQRRYGGVSSSPAMRPPEPAVDSDSAATRVRPSTSTPPSR